MTKLILIIEDDQSQRKVLKIALKKAGFEVEEAGSGYEAIDLLSGDSANRFDLVLLDMVIGDVNGKDVLRHIKKVLSALPVIVLTGYGSISNAVEAIREGAIDFITKPVEVGRLKVSIENAFRLSKLSGGLPRRSRKWSSQIGFEDLVGSSKVMKKAVNLAKKGAASNIPILLEGESGVGKEVFARAIQGASDRSDKPFIVVNCGAIPRNLVESILFGHEKGAFTGAMEKHTGKFSEANGGTLFLDEIGELPLDLQVKLLRVLQEGEVDPVGSREPVKVDVRLISATNRNLKDMVETGEFREDLFYRLNIFPVQLPPLRDRSGDIDILVPHFIENICASEGYNEKEVTLDALDLLRSYAWPGNVRQLENALFRAVILSENDVLTSADFPQINSSLYDEKLCHDQIGAMETTSRSGNMRMPNVMGQEIPLCMDQSGDIRSIQDVEKDMISFALKKYNGRMSEVARRLGLGRSTLYRKVTEFELVEKKS
ncbi:MAG: sigma-54-dependent Fis family transcriptional regulator [Emcibacter sp.]|nr:sigma-54-dependent Fis family transcriptional regulator [Emcibacter sp.]